MKKFFFSYVIFLNSLMAFCQNPQQLKDIFPGSTGSGIQQIAKTSNYTFFNAEDDDTDLDRGLYRTDGTTAGTIKLNLTYPTYISTKAEKLTALGDKIVFAGDNFAYYGEIWVSDGTQSGTIALERFQPSVSLTDRRVVVMDMAKLGNDMLYGVVNDVNHSILKKTDGTPGGTSVVYDFSGFASPPDLGLFKTINNILYFNVYDIGGSGIDQLWRSDGTTAGTYMLKDFGLNQYAASTYMTAGDLFYWMVIKPGTGNVLWKSDGTEAGTVSVKTIGTSGNNNYPHNAAIGSTLYFAGLDGNGKELWKTDGTEAGTMMVQNINAGSASSNPTLLTVLNNNLYFYADGGINGNELWKFDGTSASEVMDIYPGSTGSKPLSNASISAGFVESNGTIVFNAANDATGQELWITDGTAANTKKIRDINPLGASNPSALTPGNPVYFSATNGVNGPEIFKYDNSNPFCENCGNFVDIPDPNFEQALIDLGFDKDGVINSLISISDAEKVYDLDVNNKNISSLSGIEYFVGLKYLYCNGNLLTEINLSNNPYLINLHCGGNALTSIDLSNNLNLVSLHIYLNKLTSLDVTHNPNLEELICSSNKLTSMDISGNSKLKFLNFADNKLLNLNIANGNNANFAHPGWADYSFDARYNPALMCIKADAGIINTIPVDWFKDSSSNYNTNCPIINCDELVAIPDANFEQALINLGFDTNGLTGNIKKCDAASIIDLDINNKSISSLSGIEYFVALKYLYCNGNLLTAINVSNSPYLINLHCGSNSLTSIDLSNNPNLVSLHIYLNKLTTLDVSHNPNLEELLCSSNKLTSMDISVNPKLKFLNFADNKLLHLNIANGNNANFAHPDWANYSFDARYNPVLNCIKVDAAIINTIPSDWFKDVTSSYSTDSCESLPIIYVNDSNQTGDVYTAAVGKDTNSGTAALPFATIQNAVNRITSGGTIYVDAGTYSGQSFTISKQVQIIGTNYNVSPNSSSDPLVLNPGRNAESIIDNSSWTIGADGISITGLTFIPTGNAITLINNSYGNITLSRNRVRLNSGLPAFFFTGSGTPTIGLSGIVNMGLTIYDNRFEKEDVSSGNTVRVNRFGNVNIYNNSFVVTGTTERTQNSLAIGNAGVVTSLLIYNNTFDRAATAINSNILGYTNIYNNKFINSGIAFSGNNTLPESSEVGFRFNTLDGSAGIVPFIQYTRQGGNTAGATSSFTAEENTITGNAIATTTTLLGGMNLIFNNTVLSPSVTVRNNKITYGGDLSTIPAHLIRPIMIRGNLANAIVEKNEINLTGINQQPPTAGVDLPASPAITLYTDNTTTSFLQSGSVINILNNKINGFKNSFAAYDGTSTGKDAYVGYGNIPSGVTVNINNNSFTGDVMSINNGTVGQSVNASCNWYGSASAQDFINKISLTTVDIAPWLTNGTDNDAATGFQTVPGSCDGNPTLVTLDGYTDVTCNGSANGSINITTTYGKVPFVYTWTKDEDAGFVSHDEDPTNLTPGTYHLALVDGNGSTLYITDPQADGPETIDVTITEPSLLTATADGINNLCFGESIGTAFVIADGGTGSYTYLWNNGATTDEISNLSAGTYSVTVTDANGCTINASYEVTQPTLLTATITNNSTACSNNATVAANDGTPGYTYLWSNGDTSTSINNVPVGTYTVTVTDDNGCSTTANITLTVGEAFNPSASATDVSCFGGSNGTITVTNANGTAPFTFSKDGITFLSGTFPYSFNNLSAGTYNIAVKDANGCTGFVAKTIAQPALLTATLITVQSTCFGQSTGSISVATTGGSGALSYSWTGTGGFTSSQKNINNIAAGSYLLTVTDNNGCTALLDVVVLNFDPITVSETITHVLCRGSLTGKINLSVSGGSGSFAYSWTGSTTSTSEDIENLGPGTNYNVTITDIGNGCTVTKSYIVSQPASNLSLTAGKTNATGCGGGTITATASGGTSPYDYKLDNGNYQSTGNFGLLFSGSYTVWVKDANGCTSSKLVAITDNGSDQYESNNSKSQAKLISIGTTINARIALATDTADWFKFTPAGTGNYTLNLSHTTVNYTFNMYAAGNNSPALVPTSSVSTSKQYALTAGTTYFVQITGGLSFKCYDLSILQVISPNPAKYASTNTKVIAVDKLSVKAYPNPHQGLFNLSIISPEDGTANIQLFSILGQLLAKRDVLIEKGQNTIVEFNDVGRGIILYHLTIDNQEINGKVYGKD